MTSKLKENLFSRSSSALLPIPYGLKKGETKNFDLTSSTREEFSNNPVSDPTYLSSQLKTSDWIQRYGLESQKLSFDQILQQIGFKRLESFNAAIGKTVGPKYDGNLYQEIQNENGERFVLTCRPEKLEEFRSRLVRLLNIFKKRVTFINTGSRRIFGILAEPSICFVFDCKTADHKVFHQFQLAVKSLFKEQVSKLKRFNLLWICNDNELYQKQPVDVTVSSIDQAIDWIMDKKYSQGKISLSATCEAIVKVWKQNVHSIYLITEGESSDSAREILRDNIIKIRLSTEALKPLHVVSLFCQNIETEAFLRSIAQTAGGNFLSYKIYGELTHRGAMENFVDPTRIQLEENRVQFGKQSSTPTGESSEDVSSMYKEILHCERTIDRLDSILGRFKDERKNKNFDQKNSEEIFDFPNNETNLQRSLIFQSSALFNHEENNMASFEWLKTYGIEAQKLDFFTVLQPVAFRHCDGLVKIYQSPSSDGEKISMSPAVGKEKRIDAKYCDQFAHVTWPDGTIRHVFVTIEFYRDFQKKVQVLLEKLRARLSWLKKGSRDVFGTIIETNIYVLIDVSKSMQNHLSFVKNKLRLLIQEQLLTKEKVNLVAFNSTISPWRDRLTKIQSSETRTQLEQWLEGLFADGSTNTLAALRFALADPKTEAIYLLTDGRPDQSERHILSQVQYRQTIPVHAIAFNCQDHTANQFLFDLSKQTGGRFHAFNYGSDENIRFDFPESEDVSLLKKEITQLEKDLQRIGTLRDECLGLAWSKDSIAASYKNLAEPIRPTENLVKSQSNVDLSKRPLSYRTRKSFLN